MRGNIRQGGRRFSFCYEDVATDDNRFKTKLAKELVPDRRKSDASGKIALWAGAAMRVMDYLQTLDFIDKDNIAVMGIHGSAKPPC